MGYSGKKERITPVCLECGDKIRYGRADRKFCSDDCKSRYNYSKTKVSGAIHRRVMKQLSRNYSILADLLDSDVDSADLLGLVSMGFTPSAVTSYCRRGCHDEYCCFDIKYIMTGSRVYSISKIFD